MRLFIAASHSIAIAIADVLPGIRQNSDCCTEIGDDAVTWCDGRLLELCEPGFYDSRWVKWDVWTLPIKVPFEKWQLMPRLDKKTKLADPSAKKQLASIEALLQKASIVVNAGRPDSEGPFLVDEIIDYFGYRGQVVRLQLAEKDPVSIEKIAASMQDRSDYRNEFQAELCRSRANWLVGHNMSRAVTKLLARDRLISVGRIQTPMLALIARAPEKHYTKLSLIREMQAYARCGTNDIDILETREFIEVDKGRIKITALGRSLVLALPGQLTDVTVAAAWENALHQVAAGDYPPEEFMRRLDIFVEKRLQEIKDLAGKVTISSQGKPGPQSHQKTMSAPRARTANKSAASQRGQNASKPSR